MARIVIQTKHPLDVRPDRPSESSPFAPRFFFSGGYGNEREYVIENLSILIDSGIGVAETIRSIKEDIRKKRLREALDIVLQKVESGSPLWKSLDASGIFPRRMLSLVRVGEESGKLPEYLGLAAMENRKERMFVSRIRSALLYPAITLVVALAVAVGSAWYTLPKILSIVTQLGGTPSWSTRVVIASAEFVRDWGAIALPLFLILVVAIVYIIFFHPRAKIVGEHIIFGVPGIRSLVRGIEEIRFGYILGSTLKAGVPVVQALTLLSESTNFILYRRLYTAMAKGVENGKPLFEALAAVPHSKHYISGPFQQMVRASERSGKLSDTLLKIGMIMEEKTSSQAKDVSTVLEPVVLIFVALIVGFIALAIINPIYSISTIGF